MRLCRTLPDRTATAIKSLLLLFFRKEVLAFLFCVFLWLRLYPVDLHRAHDVSLELQGSDGEVLNAHIAHDGIFRLQTVAADVDPAYLALLLRSEDARFYVHPGVDPVALARAAFQLLTHGRIVSGGSTLTMQVARLLHPHRHTFVGKMRDIVTALRLETQFSKQRILALYLTLAPFGANIEGVRAASLVYFGHAPDHLSPAEAALLVAVPQSPTRRRPDRFPAAAQSALQRVLVRAGMEAQPWVPSGRRHLPADAPHLATEFRLAGLAGLHRTTLDPALQRATQALARRQIGWSGSGVDMAALIVRNSDRAVLAYLGGSDFFARFGMIDMVRAIRSPGSALKPFIYGMALDDGLIRPDTLIDDAKLRIADYAPQDFDRNFHGTVTAAEALQQSYNLPAVTLLDWLGAGRVAASLRGAGTHLVIPGNAPATLPLALGGVGLDLWDLTQLYAGLAAGGTVSPLRLTPSDPGAPASALLSAKAARDIIDILAGAPPPAGLSVLSSRRIAYKTGTSFGFRDAWAIGCTPAFTIGVWVGRPDGTPRPGAFARGTAAPLLFRLFDLMPEDPGWKPAAALSLPGARAPYLQHLRLRGDRLFAADPPRIVFPPAGATLEAPEGAPLDLEAAGGTPPYRWIVNGVPLPAAALGSAPSWQPDGVGFVHLTLTDSADVSVQEEIRIQ